MAMSNDENLLEYRPDILDFGIDDFDAEHAKARNDILRRIRKEWWPRTGFSGEMDETLLDETQFTQCAVYLVLSEYALPRLTKWNAEGDEDKFQVMMAHYKDKYEKEFNAVLMDGVKYDFNDDNTVSDTEQAPRHTRRIVR